MPAGSIVRARQYGSGIPAADDPCCFLRRSGIRYALASSKCSALGPDGPPYAAGRQLGPLAEEVLLHAGRVLTPNGLDDPRQAFPAGLEGEHDFNAALTVFLPDRASGEADGMQVFFLS